MIHEKQKMPFQMLGVSGADDWSIFMLPSKWHDESWPFIVTLHTFDLIPSLNKVLNNAHTTNNDFVDVPDLSICLFCPC